MTVLLTHLLLLLLEHVGLGSEMRQRVRTWAWATHSRLHAHHRSSLRNVRSIRTRHCSRMHLHGLTHGLTRVWSRSRPHGMTMWNAGLLDTTRMMWICASHHLDLWRLQIDNRSVSPVALWERTLSRSGPVHEQVLYERRARIEARSLRYC